jgi:hypothetical protein
MVVPITLAAGEGGLEGKGVTERNTFVTKPSWVFYPERPQLYPHLGGSCCKGSIRKPQNILIPDKFNLGWNAGTSVDAKIPAPEVVGLGRDDDEHVHRVQLQRRGVGHG